MKTRKLLTYILFAAALVLGVIGFCYCYVGYSNWENDPSFEGVYPVNVLRDVLIYAVPAIFCLVMSFVLFVTNED